MNKIILSILAGLVFLLCMTAEAEWVPQDAVPARFKYLRKNMTKTEVMKAVGAPAYMKMESTNYIQRLMYVMSWGGDRLKIVKLTFRGGRYQNAEVELYTKSPVDRWGRVQSGK